MLGKSLSRSQLKNVIFTFSIAFLKTIERIERFDPNFLVIWISAKLLEDIFVFFF